MNQKISHGYQMDPIVRLGDCNNSLWGYEALCRISGGRWVDKDRRLVERLHRILSDLETAETTSMTINLNTESIIVMPEKSIGELASLKERLVIEWVEHPAMEHSVEMASRILKKWRNRYGFRIAIDDVGRGHDGIERFLSVEADIVKVDGSILKKANTSAIYRRAIDHIVHMFSKENVPVIIEWIESDTDLKIALESGASLGQGWMFAEGKTA